MAEYENQTPRVLGDPTHAYGTAAVRVSQVAAGGVPAHACFPAVLRPLRQGSRLERAFPRRMACGDKYAFSYISRICRSPCYSATCGRHGDGSLRVLRSWRVGSLDGEESRQRSGTSAFARLTSVRDLH